MIPLVCLFDLFDLFDLLDLLDLFDLLGLFSLGWAMAGFECLRQNKIKFLL